VLSTNNTLDAKVNLNDSNASNYILTASNNLVNRVIEGVGRGSNYVLYSSNNLINKVKENDSNASNYVLSTNNTLDAKVNLNDSNASNYVLSTSNVISTRITNLTTDMITENISGVKKFIVNNSYNNNLLVNGNLTINSNLIVYGESTRLETTVYTTERLEVVNANNGSVALMAQQMDNFREIFIASNINSRVLTITNSGDVNIIGNYKKNNRDVIDDTSNYVLITSNYLVNYNNLINKPDLTVITTNNTNLSNYVLATSNYFALNGGAPQVNSDWNSVSGFSQILNKPDLTVITTNNTNVSNYVLITSNYLVNYNNLINKPTIPAPQVNSDWNSVSGFSQILNKPDLTVINTNNTNVSNYVLITSNYLVNYNNLINKPTIPAAQVNSDWNSVSGFSQILNKPDLTVITTNNTNLSNYVLATSNYFALNGGGGGSGTTLVAGAGISIVGSTISTYWTLASTNIYFNLAGNVGIGTTNPAQKLHVVGDIAATGKVTSYYSDERLKTNISNISNSLDIINNIKGFYYEPNEIAISLGIKNRGREVGLSAQDVNRMVPEVVSLAPIDIHRDLDNNLVSKSGSNYLTVNYERLIPILVESIKELNIQITQLKKENAEFRAFKDRISKYYE
jgi:hypothetical protein